MKKEFIPYDQALELKELGFNEECMAYYFIYQDVLHFDIMNNETVNNEVDAVKTYCIAPLYQQAFRWLREKYSCQSYIDILNNSFAYWIGIKSINFYYHSFNSTPRDNKFDTSWETYESAELACLKKLIEIAKNK